MESCSICGDAESDGVSEVARGGLGGGVAGCFLPAEKLTVKCVIFFEVHTTAMHKQKHTVPAALHISSFFLS